MYVCTAVRLVCDHGPQCEFLVQIWTAWYCGHSLNRRERKGISAAAEDVDIRAAVFMEPVTDLHSSVSVIFFDCCRAQLRMRDLCRMNKHIPDVVLSQAASKATYRICAKHSLQKHSTGCSLLSAISHHRWQLEFPTTAGVGGGRTGGRM
jgi:hypothetical protein